MSREETEEKQEIRHVCHMYDSGPNVVRNVFSNRGWGIADGNFLETISGMKNNEPVLRLSWRGPRYRRSEYAAANKFLRLNHFSDSGTITKKDKLLLVLRKMKAIHGQSVYGFWPCGFILPTEYMKFVKEYSEDNEPNSLWICKPADLSRGRKIFLLKSLHELKYDQKYIIQKYIPNPLTIGGYKHDLRVYVLVTSFQPLQVWLYKDGIVRFGTQKYEGSDIDNLYAHLTNASINKNSNTYLSKKDVIGSGSKWDFSTYRNWLKQNRNEAKFDTIWNKIVDIAILTILAAVTNSDRDAKGGCFELFGFDILIDEFLEPWLIEVNCAPSMSCETKTDEKVKIPLVNDMIDVLLEQENSKWGNQAFSRGQSTFQKRKAFKSYKKSACDKDAAEKKFDSLAKTIGNFEMVFPFNSATFETSETMFTATRKKNGDIAPHVRSIVQTVRKRAMRNKRKSKAT